MESKNDKGFFGQPKGLRTLFFTEFWERFSYYGMRAILMLYMFDTVANGGLNFPKVTAASIMSIYGALVMMSSVLGGYLSDRVFGTRRSMFWGGFLIMIGHIILSLPFGAAALFISIGFITVGTGMLKPAASSMVGGLYSPEDTRRDAGFSIFVLGVNFGSLLAPLVVGYAQSQYNYHVGFSLAAIGMFFGLVYYAWDGKRTLTEESLHVPNPITKEERSSVIKMVLLGLGALIVLLGIMAVAGVLNVENIILIISILGVTIPIIYFILMLKSAKVTKVEKSRVRAYILLFLAAVVFWSIEEQGSSILALVVAEHTDLNFMGMQLQVPQFQMLNPFFIVLYTPFFAWMWTKLGTKQPSSPTKFWLGLIFTGVSFLVLAIPLSGSGKISPLWLVLSWAIVMVGELLISPVGLSVTTKLAPKAYASQMLSLWFLADAAGQAINAQIVRFYEMSPYLYFGIIGSLVIVFAIILALLTPKIKPLMQGVN
ncbi:MFS transporter [Companilactobacillus sp. RD055328]|uniref:peptide MFS transporter n=1 Tax=Companilactobacillus sp. RD055328 TaxID=2916634 RepID=UPI001FC892E2|nr:peptide MFS transporter [Companilactobacillus sp. RD055328]GKQ43169.1 MFS transporter [Companilactobacillus sp. RD055328]